MACRLAGAKPLSESMLDGILLIGPLGTHFSEISIEIHTFPFKKMHLKMSSGKWRPFCLGLSVLSNIICHVDCASPLRHNWTQCISHSFLLLYFPEEMMWHQTLGSTNYTDVVLSYRYCYHRYRMVHEGIIFIMCISIPEKTSFILKRGHCLIPPSPLIVVTC